MKKAFCLASGRLVTVAGTVRAAFRPALPTPAFPLFFDLNDGCNLHCTMRGSNRRSAAAQHVMKPDTFRRSVLPILGRAADFQFGCLFEPMLVPYYDDAVTWIAGILPPGVRGKSISNGTLLTGRKVRSVIESDIFRILSFSINAASEDLFRKIRRGADFQRVIRNIRALLDYRMRKGSTARIELNFAIQRINVDELPAVVRLAADPGNSGVTTHKLYPDDAGCIDREYLRTIEENIAKAAEIAARGGSISAAGVTAPQRRKGFLPWMTRGPAVFSNRRCPYEWIFGGISTPPAARSPGRSGTSADGESTPSWADGTPEVCSTVSGTPSRPPAGVFYMFVPAGRIAGGSAAME